MDICTNCARPIEYREAPEGIDPGLSYWTHTELANNWCWLDTPNYYEMDPASRDTKAEPAHA